MKQSFLKMIQSSWQSGKMLRKIIKGHLVNIEWIVGLYTSLLLFKLTRKMRRVRTPFKIYFLKR